MGVVVVDVVLGVDSGVPDVTNLAMFRIPYRFSPFISKCEIMFDVHALYYHVHNEY
mgnify:FL=1